jgi:hypothetical protein
MEEHDTVTTTRSTQGDLVKVYEQAFVIPAPKNSSDKLLGHCAEEVRRRLPAGVVATRFVITGKSADGYLCETGVLEGGPADTESVFEFTAGKARESSKFTVALMIPTGIGSEIGGHAGDAGPAARLIGSVCDRLILHPNVVNGSELNEMPDNALYVEGSVFTRLMMGSIGLRPTRSNRILYVAEGHPDVNVTNVGINIFNGARAVVAADGAGVMILDEPFSMSVTFSEISGRATGKLENLGVLIEALRARRDTFDAIALHSRITYGAADYRRYLQSSSEEGVNPIGGVEAMLTHTISMCLGVPSAHSPQLNLGGWWGSVGLCEPSKSVEPACLAFLQCILKGLHKSPRIVSDRQEMNEADVVRGTDVDCIVMPDRCLGLPVLAALERGTKVIAVRDRHNVMKNDLSELPWRSNQLYFVDNYLEAAGMLCALRGGVSPETLRRPLPKTSVFHV